MRTQLIHEQGQLRTLLAVLNSGDEVMASLKALAERKGSPRHI